MENDNVFVEDSEYEKKLKLLKKKHMNPFQGILDVRKRLRIFFRGMNDSDMEELRDLSRTMQYARDKALSIIK